MPLDPRIPAQLKIGGLIYKVCANAELPNHNLMGHARHMECEIHIDPAIVPDKQCCVLLHEILHAIDVQHHFGWDEDMTDRLEYALFQVFKDNRLHFDETPPPVDQSTIQPELEHHCETCCHWGQLDGSLGPCDQLGRPTHWDCGCDQYKRDYSLLPRPKR